MPRKSIALIIQPTKNKERKFIKLIAWIFEIQDGKFYHFKLSQKPIVKFEIPSMNFVIF